MRFFSGIRGGDTKKVSASALYKQKLSGKVVAEKTPQQKYQEAIEAKMQKMMEDVIMGRKKDRPKIPGIKSLEADDEAPKKVSKNAQMMLKLLAMQKLQKEQKKEKKKTREAMWAEKAKKKAAAFAKAAQDAQEYDKRQSEEAATAAAAAAAAAAVPAASTYNYGYSTSDDNNGW
jgi:hypothetical protein